jgi:hypothetical protein
VKVGFAMHCKRPMVHIVVLYVVWVHVEHFLKDKFLLDVVLWHIKLLIAVDLL